MANGLKVMWDMIKEVKVEVPDSMKGKVCGLCGNFDGDKTNDFTLGPLVTGYNQYITQPECGSMIEDGNYGEQVR